MSIRLAIALALVLSVPTIGLASGGRTDAAAPVRKITVSPFGNVLATPKRQALYYWNVEKRDFKVHCTGACARAWPPLIVRSASAVPRRIAGVSGAFGTIRRPDGKLQVTRNKLPVYTYAHEGPGEVRCDNVDGWFVVRV
jgi:predicted lipoprotein with Yx(FWY)xxD motif